MAQTIAMQRGTTTITANGTGPTTLFTQSGGTATRVIINGIAGYSGGSSSYWCMMLSVTNSGTSVNLPVAFKSTGGFTGSIGGCFFLSGLGAASNGGAQYSGAATTASAAVLGNYANTWPRSGDPIIAGANGSLVVSGSQAAVYEYCPQNFWIGPGDQVCLGLYNSAGSSVNVAFNFTTVTES
jgi:hypothetical protein